MARPGTSLLVKGLTRDRGPATSLSVFSTSPQSLTEGSAFRADALSRLGPPKSSC